MVCKEINIKVKRGSKSIKYLGINFNEFLRFNDHVKLAIGKANGALRKIYFLLRKKVGLSTKTKLILYKTLIRPIICYGAPSWITCSSKAMDKCMSFERRVLRHCTGLSYNWKTKKCGRNAIVYRRANIDPIREYILNIMEIWKTA